ncbi:DUF1127 domain-containing protein [Pseudomonas sp. NA-150]|uniref:DUF1127 domain-containing protein n=1 Tax=Pseudomonas sp. NA-150 TaxID=3367525 RepID=UPI0037C6628B
MNGMSDVRLMLRGQELLDEQAHSIQMVRSDVYPATSRLGLFLHRWASRKPLLEMDADQLRDIGITRQQARAEGLKPFWKS